MAEIVTITNPLTGQPVQVDQLEHTAQQIDDGIGFESTDYPGCYYRMVGGVVEWFNPPMILGVEYRTTERYMGKPVYAKAINLGAGPSSYAQVSAYHGIANVGHIVDFGAELTKDGASALSMPYKVSDTNQGCVSANHTRIILYAGDSDLTGYNQCTGWIKCTKTTD